MDRDLDMSEEAATWGSEEESARPEAGVSLAYARYEEKAMWLELSECRGEETGEDRGTKEPGQVGPSSSQ